ncbi:MAG: hypothetical protein QM778_29650 [Myxococcales bacterium]
MTLPLALALGFAAACSSDPPLQVDRGPIEPGDGDGDQHNDEDDHPRGDGDAEDAGQGQPDAGPVKHGPTPVTLAECTAASAGLSADRLNKLRAGGELGDMRFIYPYDGTVFPRGLAAPVLMWKSSDTEQADAVYVHIKSSWFEYSGCMKPDAKGRIALPQEVWEQAGAQSPGKSDPFSVELSAIRGSMVRGPLTQSIIIAPASLKGSVFYNSYSSPLAMSKGAPGGAVLRIPSGGEAEVFLGQTGCVGCHSVSAHGNRLVVSASEVDGVYKLEPKGAVNPPALRGNSYGNVGLTPDGTIFVAEGSMFETDTGDMIGDAGLPLYAHEGNFSPDGKQLTFVDYDSDAGVSVLASMSWDQGARKLGDYKSLMKSTVDAQGMMQPNIEWPTFLPDSKAVIFADINKNDLFITDVATGKVTLLARAVGFKSTSDAAQDTTTYLPFGADELHQSYYPTVAPVAAGGYFWVFFDTSRHYGNFDTTKIDPVAPQPPVVVPVDPLCAALPFLCPDPVPVDPGPSTPAVQSRQLWVTAIEISPDGSYTSDPSAPAFYLPGQEIGANNHRAFAALDPCLPNGQSCESGTECCEGYCTEGVCSGPTDSCSKTEEACDTSADCCDEQDRCINGFCSFVLL